MDGIWDLQSSSDALQGSSREMKMSGIIVFISGISMIALAVILFAAGIIYRKTAGKRICEELKDEYE